jgi:hypothetical protein
MDLSSGEFSASVFKRSVKDDLDEFSLNSQMLKVLMELDGKKNLASVARSAGMDMGTLKEVITKLHGFRLIETVENAIPLLNNEFFDFLTSRLSLAVGPIAEFLIEDEMMDFADDPTKVPLHRAAELVNQLARQIPRKEKKIAFQQAMIQKIKEIKP